jgi:hypothetical protein
MALRLELPADSSESSVRDALRRGGAERKKREKAEREKPADVFERQVRAMGLPQYMRESLFALKVGRKWAFDFCWGPPYMLAVEIEGLVVRRINGVLQVMGRHATITGFREDCEKYANAAMLGWTVVRFEQTQVDSRYAVNMVARILEVRGWKVDKPTVYAQLERARAGELDFGKPG